MWPNPQFPANLVTFTENFIFCAVASQRGFSKWLLKRLALLTVLRHRVKSTWFEAIKIVYDFLDVLEVFGCYRSTMQFQISFGKEKR